MGKSDFIAALGSGNFKDSFAAQARTKEAGIFLIIIAMKKLMKKWTIKPRILLSPTKCHFNLTSRLFETNIASWMYETSRNARSIYLAWSVQYGIGSIRLGKELPITDITVLINQKVEGTGGIGYRCRLSGAETAVEGVLDELSGPRVQKQTER